MVNTKCFVPGCFTGFQSELRKRNAGEKISLFHVPKGNVELFELWKRKLPRHGFKRSDSVCEKHFLKSDIIRFSEIKLKDGSVYRSCFGRPRLVPNAIPRIFPNLPEFLTDKKLIKKPRRYRVSVASTQMLQNHSTDSTSSSVSDNDVTFSHLEQIPEYTFTTLSEDLEKIKIDWPEWFSNKLTSRGEEFILISHIGPFQIPDKFVKINADLTVTACLASYNSSPPISLPVAVIGCLVDMLSTLQYVTEFEAGPDSGSEMEALC